MEEKVFKELMGYLAVAIMLIAYGVQLIQTYRGKSEPHPITWIGFGFLVGAGYLVQLQKGAGPGSWVMGLTAIFCLLAAGRGFGRKGDGGLGRVLMGWTGLR